MSSRIRNGSRFSPDSATIRLLRTLSASFSCRFIGPQAVPTAAVCQAGHIPPVPMAFGLPTASQVIAPDINHLENHTFFSVVPC